MRHRYRLIDAVDSRELGWFMSHRDDWQPGDFIGSSSKPRRFVLTVIEPEDDADFRAYLVVVPVGELDAAEATALLKFAPRPRRADAPSSS
jgi:hypothetical protein